MTAPNPHNDTMESNATHNCQLNEMGVAIAACYCVVFIIGICGNVFVLLVFRGQWRKGPIIELLILYLAVFDLLASFFGPVVFFYWIITCHRQWHFGTLGCKMLPTLSRVTTDISIGVILIMALDRCRVIVTPLKGRFHRGTIHAAVALCVLLSVIWETYYFNALVLDENGACNTVSVSDPTYSYPLVCLTAVRDVAFICIFTATTIAVYVKLEDTTSVQLLKNDQQSRSRNSKVMKMLVVMAVTFSLAVIPRDILHLAYTVSWINGWNGIPHTSALLVANDIGKLLQISNSTYNVFIYAKMHDQFWTVLKLLLTCHGAPKFIYTVKTRNNSQNYLRKNSRSSVTIHMKQTNRESRRSLLVVAQSYSMKPICHETEGSTGSEDL